MGVVSDILFGKNKEDYRKEYDKALQDTKQSRADAAYQYRYNKALYDANKDYFDKAGIKDPSASYWNKNGQRTNAYLDTMNQYGKYLNDLQSEKEKVMKQQKYNILGDGLIGTLINPIHQAGTAIQDFVSSGTSEWDKGNRDALSDLGAAAESAMTLIPMAKGVSLYRAGKAAKAGTATAAQIAKLQANQLKQQAAKTLGSRVGKGALYGAGYNAINSTREMGGQNFNLGNLLGSAASGAAFGAGMGALGYGVGKVGDKLADYAAKNRMVQTPETITSTLYNDMGDAITPSGVSYQDALKKAGLDKVNNPGDSHLIERVMQGAEISSSDLTPQTARRLTDKINTFVKELGGTPKTAAKTIYGITKYNPGAEVQNLKEAIERIKTIPGSSQTTTVTNVTYPGLAASRRGQILQGATDLVANPARTIKAVGNKAADTKIGGLTSKLLSTKAGKVGVGVGGGLLLSRLMNRNNKEGE